MEINLTPSEIENLLMMYEHCKRHYQHTYAETAIAKLRKARAAFLTGKPVPVAEEKEPTLLPLDFS